MTRTVVEIHVRNRLPEALFRWQQRVKRYRAADGLRTSNRRLTGFFTDATLTLPPLKAETFAGFVVERTANLPTMS